MAEKYKSIGMKESQYLAIADKKRLFESTVGRRFDWGSFLLILAGLRSVEELGDQRRYEVAELHEGEPVTDQEMAEAGIEEFDGLPVTLAESDQERIAELVAAKVVQQLAKRELG